MWIDTHIHLEAVLPTPNAVDKMRDLGVSAQVVPAVAPAQFDALVQAAAQQDGVFFALGIHPFWADSGDLATMTSVLHQTLRRERDNPRLVAMGEMGLDGRSSIAQEIQLACFRAQLRLAREFDLPVLLHANGAVEATWQSVRQMGVTKGIVHAFNGSYVQAHHWLNQGFKLGFGGVLTYPRARKIRALAQQLPIEGLVLETDAPDMPPAWVPRGASNLGAYLPQIGEVLAALRGLSVTDLQAQLWLNTLAALPLMQDSLGMEGVQ